MLHRRLTTLQSLTRITLDGPLLGGQPGAAHAACGGVGHQRPWSSQVEEPKEEGEPDFVYTGPFSQAVKRVKRLSLFSCACAVGAGPIILALDTSGMALSAKASVAVTLGGFGVLTTGLLHWFTSPYVHRLAYHRDSDTAEVHSLTMLTKPLVRRFPVSDVGEVDTVHPLSSFQFGGKTYYVDAEHFQDKELLARLVPSTAAAAQGEGAQEEAESEGSEGDGEEEEERRQRRPQETAQS